LLLSNLQPAKKIVMMEDNDAVDTTTESHFILPQDEPSIYMEEIDLADEEVAAVNLGVPKGNCAFSPIAARSATTTPVTLRVPAGIIQNRKSNERLTTFTPKSFETGGTSASPRTVGGDSGKLFYRFVSQRSQSDYSPSIGESLGSITPISSDDSIQSTTAFDEGSNYELFVGEDGYPFVDVDGPDNAKFRYEMSLIIRNARDITEGDKCTPDLTPNSFSDCMPSGRRIYLGDRLYSSKMSTVFALPSSPGIVAKYQTDCFEDVLDNEVHPLVKDFLFLKEVRSIDVSPRAFYVSPPSKNWPTSLPFSGFGLGKL
jgi:hypothetical protein